jgi:hypothetical protein
MGASTEPFVRITMVLESGLLSLKGSCQTTTALIGLAAKVLEF